MLKLCFTNTCFELLRASFALVVYNNTLLFRCREMKSCNVISALAATSQPTSYQCDCLFACVSRTCGLVCVCVKECGCGVCGIHVGAGGTYWPDLPVKPVILSTAVTWQYSRHRVQLRQFIHHPHSWKMLSFVKTHSGNKLMFEGNLVTCVRSAQQHQTHRAAWKPTKLSPPFIFLWGGIDSEDFRRSRRFSGSIKLFWLVMHVISAKQLNLCTIVQLDSVCVRFFRAEMKSYEMRRTRSLLFSHRDLCAIFHCGSVGPEKRKPVISAMDLVPESKGQQPLHPHRPLNMWWATQTATGQYSKILFLSVVTENHQKAACMSTHTSLDVL